VAVLKFAGFALSTAIVVIAVFVGCYSPEAPDCTLACTADTDCISGQACTTDHMCAATSITTCSNQETPDAGHVAGTDAGSGSGSAATVTVTIQVQGGGGVRTNDGDFCDGAGDMMNTCMFQVVAGEPMMLTPVPHVLRQFDKWMGPPCMNQPLGCSLTAMDGLMVQQARFH
jgi:hypothetical protein